MAKQEGILLAYRIKFPGGIWNCQGKLAEVMQ